MTDSLAVRSAEALVVREAVTADTAVLAVAADSVRSLPEGAGYTARSGRASVEVRKRAGGVIEVRGTCDSLERAVSYWAGRAEHYRSALAARDTMAAEEYAEHTKEVRGSPPGWFVKGMAAGAAAVCMVILIVKRKKEK